MSLRGTKQSQTVQIGFVSSRLLRVYPRCFSGYNEIVFERWQILTRRGFARHPLFGFAGKRELHGEYL